ncbi:MAG: hypothetical protein KIS94_06070 [Chitinophagales bacterium]|nr:hypothetical protein [Chitinophagales bacterium]
MDAKYQCSFCGKTNTKFEAINQSSGLFGMSSTKIGEREVIDEKAPKFHRCRNCGKIICAPCGNKMGAFQEKVRILLPTQKWTVCPKCSGELIQLN